MSEIKIEKPILRDADEILGLYNDIIDNIKDSLYRPDWHKNLYPVLNHILQAIEQGQMWVAKKDHRIVATMILNHTHNESYNTIKWQKELVDQDVWILHLLGVHPDYLNQGIASTMVDFAKALAKKKGIQSIRLDVFNRNVFAEQLYLKKGFKLMGTVRQRYEETNWKYSNLFEYLIEDEKNSQE